jgi:hypothetical protein
MIDALLQLGQQQRVPIGIEYIDAAAFRSRITLHVRNSTMGSLLDTITHGQGYRLVRSEWSRDGNAQRCATGSQEPVEHSQP